MNSLTTIGGTVIDEVEMGHGNCGGGNSGAGMRKPPLLSHRSRGGRMNHRMRRVKSVDDTHHNRLAPSSSSAAAAAHSTAVNSMDEPSTRPSLPPTNRMSTARPTLSRASLSRHRSAPVHRTSRTVNFHDEYDDEYEEEEDAELDIPPPPPPLPPLMPPEYAEYTTPPSRSKVVSSSGSLRSSRMRYKTLEETIEEEESEPTIPKQRRIHESVNNRNSSIVSQLHEISKLEPYASSSYFQRIFSRGIERVTQYEEEKELNSVEDALRTCFDVNEDMVRVIVAAGMAAESEAAAAAGARGKLEREQKLGREREQIASTLAGQDRNEDGPTGTNEVVHTRTPKPWETPSTPGSASHHRIKTISPSHPSQFATPTDLSGYTHKTNHTFKHLPSLPLPPTPPTPGKLHDYSPDEFELVQHDQEGDELHNTPFHSMPSLSSTPSPSIHEEVSHDRHNHHHRHRATSMPSPTIQEELDRSSRKDKARARVQGYLSKIDNRIRSVKEGQHAHSSSASSGLASLARPGNYTKRVQSTGLAEGRAVEQHKDNHHQPRPWDSFDMSKSTTRKQLFLPTLLSPEDGNVTDGVPSAWEKTSSSVFRANNKEAARDEGTMDVPLDESNEPQQQVLLPPYDSMASVSIGGSDNAEQRIKAAERSVGLKSLHEYKELLKEKTMEVEGLEHRYKTHVQEATETLEARDDELKQFRVAMEEAERAVLALEETIGQLEQASNTKDEMIVELEGRVKVLETELDQTKATKLEKEGEHQEMVTKLNESIAQLGTDVKEKDVSIIELQTKTQELEAELAKTMEQYTEAKAELENAHSAIAQKDQRLRLSEQELLSTKELLQGQMELYKTEISSSLENTTQLMDLMSREKDSLINSLHAKITMLEQSLSELEEEKELGDTQHVGTEKELNDKIQTLALALTEKDRQIDELNKEQTEMKKKVEDQAKERKDGSNGRRRRTEESSRRGSDGDVSRQRRRSRSRHRHSYREPHSTKKHHNRNLRRMITPEGYYEPQQLDAMLPRERYYDETRDDEVVMMMEDGQHPVMYYTTSAEDGDSIFDFTSP